MTSDKNTVDKYFETLPDDRVEPMKKIRSLCLVFLDGYEETMDYGMPSYKNDEIEISFNSQKNNISFYVHKYSLLDQYRDNFPKSAVGKSCLRFKNMKKIDYEVIENLLKDTYNSDEPVGC